MDGNFLIRGDLNELLDNYLSDVNFCHDHMNCRLDPRNCVYNSVNEVIIWLGEKRPK